MTNPFSLYSQHFDRFLQMLEPGRERLPTPDEARQLPARGELERESGRRGFTRGQIIEDLVKRNIPLPPPNKLDVVNHTYTKMMEEWGWRARFSYGATSTVNGWEVMLTGVELLARGSSWPCDLDMFERQHLRDIEEEIEVELNEIDERSEP